jgi:lipopolysaccharide export system protein LptA
MNLTFRYLFLGILVNLLLPILAFGQTGKKIEVRNADALEFDERIPDAQRLIGNVLLEHEGTLLYCDSAYLYDVQNRMEAFSNVRIVGDSLIMTGKQLLYDGKTKIADVTGDVRLVDPSTILTTDKLRYDLKSKVASYSTGGKIISTKNKNELTSQIGQYNSTKRMFYFNKQVVLSNPKYTMRGDTLQYNTVLETAYFFGPTTISSEENKIYCESGNYNTRTDISQYGKHAKITSKGQEISGNSLWYDRKAGLGKARNQVMIYDSSEQVIITGDYVDYFEKSDRMLITQQAELKKLIGGDTLFLHGDTLKSFKDTLSNKRTILAYKHVKFYKEDFQGRCDSLSFTEQDSMMRFYGKPVIWSGENQLSADSISMQLAKNEIQTLYLRLASFIVSEEDSLHFNQIKGKHITGHLIKNELRKIDVKGNGQSIYFAEDADGYIGVNKADCSDMLIYVDSNKVKRITFITKPTATLFPVNELPSDEAQLNGFNWQITHRPLKEEDIFKWQEPVDAKRKKQKQLK